MFGIFLVSVVVRHQLDSEMAKRFTDNVTLALKLINELDGENMTIPPPLKVVSSLFPSCLVPLLLFRLVLISF